MIKYEWRTWLDPEETAELAEMLERAAAYDAEPEYSTIQFGDVAAAIADEDHRYRHLLIWMLPHATRMAEHDEPQRIAGLLRLEFTGADVADVRLVIDPRFRSIGITTLLVEQVGLDTGLDGGWLGTGARTLQSWARGNHPASGRLSNRFLIPRTRRIWKLIRTTDSVYTAAAAPVLESVAGAATNSFALREGGVVVGSVSLDTNPVYSEEFGPCATVTAVGSSPAADTGALRRVLDGAAAIAHEAGLSGLIVHVDSGDGRLVNACRLVGFQHDRTDVQYQVSEDR